VRVKKRTLKRRGIKDFRVEAIFNPPLAQAVTAENEETATAMAMSQRDCTSCGM
jgi:hypothetical protein